MYEQHFAAEDETAYAGILDRGDSLVRWITEPIDGETGIEAIADAVPRSQRGAV